VTSSSPMVRGDGMETTSGGEKSEGVGRRSPANRDGLGAATRRRGSGLLVDRAVVAGMPGLPAPFPGVVRTAGSAGPAAPGVLREVRRGGAEPAEKRRKRTHAWTPVCQQEDEIWSGNWNFLPDVLRPPDRLCRFSRWHLAPSEVLARKAWGPPRSTVRTGRCFSSLPLLSAFFHGISSCH